MKKFSYLLNDYRFIIILILFAVGSHVQWFNPFSILNFSDWSYWPFTATKQLYYSYGAWINFFNLGATNIQLSFNFFTSFWSLFANFGLQYDLAAKVTILIPTAIMGFLSPYILFKKITNEQFIAFAVALFYGATTHFLIRQTAHIPIAFVYALAPLVIYYFIVVLEKNRLINWLGFVAIFSIIVFYEVRIAYIISILLIFYFLIFASLDFKKYWKNILISGFIFFGFSSFWLLPTMLEGALEAVSGVANRGLFGSHLFNLFSAFTLFESSWTGGLPDNQFIRQPIIWYFWIIPILVFIVFLFNRSNRHKKEIIFFGLISILGIFLTKQSMPPLEGAYKWLYDNFPGFNLFREASKFYLITAIGYSGLLAYSLLSFKNSAYKILNRYIFFVLSLLIILISFLNLRPLINQEIRTMFIAKNIPKDYITFKEFILNEHDYFRTFWMPTYSRWGFFDNARPKVGGVKAINNDWKELLVTFYIKNNKIEERIVDIFNLSFSNNLLDMSSIKYVIVPIQDIANDDDFFVHYGGRTDPNIREWYIDELDKIAWLNKIDIGTEELVIYENSGYRPHIYVTDEIETIYKETEYQEVEHKFKNPTEYQVSLRDLSEPVYLNFSESYHPDWKLRVGDFNWFKVLYKKDYFLPDADHFQNDATLSSFYLDPAQVCGRYDCLRNEDGSYDLNLTLYFRPQSYFYLGLIISATTLAGCLAYLGYDFVNRRRRREEGDQADNSEITG